MPIFVCSFLFSFCARECWKLLFGQHRERTVRDLQTSLTEAVERLSKYDGLPESEQIRRRMVDLEVTSKTKITRRPRLLHHCSGALTENNTVAHLFPVA